jgi:hypothetical protein
MTAPRFGPATGARRAARRQRTRQRLAWAVLLLACLAVLAWPALEGVRLTRSLLHGAYHERTQREEALFDCLAGRVDDLVSPGRKVFVRPGDDLSVHQRLTEAVVDRQAHPVLDAGDADLTLVVGPGPGAPPPGPRQVDAAALPPAAPTCGGVTVTAVAR